MQYWQLGSQALPMGSQRHIYSTDLHVVRMHIRHSISCTILASSALSETSSLHVKVSGHMRAH